MVDERGPCPRPSKACGLTTEEIVRALLVSEPTSPLSALLEDRLMHLTGGKLRGRRQGAGSELR
jgi:hypothetical protein